MLKFTNEQVTKFYVASNFNKVRTAQMMGITRKELTEDYLDIDPELKDMFIDAEEARVDAAEDALLELAKEGGSQNFAAIKFLLETKGASRGYANKAEVVHTTQSTEVIKALERKYEDEL